MATGCVHGITPMVWYGIDIIMIILLLLEYGMVDVLVESDSGTAIIIITKAILALASFAAFCHAFLIRF